MAKKRLSPKMIKFCQNIVDGKSYVESYIDAYNFTGTRNSAGVEANKLLLREDIQEKIKDIRKPIEEAIQLKSLSNREKKLKIIWERLEICIAKEDEVSIARYLEILNKMDGEYVTQFKQVDNRPPEIVKLDTDQLRKLVSS